MLRQGLRCRQGLRYRQGVLMRLTRVSVRQGLAVLSTVGVGRRLGRGPVQGGGFIRQGLCWRVSVRQPLGTYHGVLAAWAHSTAPLPCLHILRAVTLTVYMKKR